MLIVLEGCDGTGKTTLMNILKSCYPIDETIHCTAETPNTYEYFYDIVRRSKHKNIICDRFFWGQFVYQKLSERKLTTVQLHALYSEMRICNPDNRIILVEAGLDDILNRLNKRAEVTELPVQTIVQKFRELACRACYRVPVLLYNSSNGIIERMK